MQREKRSAWVRTTSPEWLKRTATAGVAIAGIESLVFQACGAPLVVSRANLATVGALFLVVSYLGDEINVVSGVLASFLGGFVLSGPLWRLLAKLA